MTINNFTAEVQLWNFKTKQFDELGTPFDLDVHLNDKYHLKNEQQMMIDVINCGDNHYWATLIDGMGHAMYVAPGFYRINRLGYIIYKAEDVVSSDCEYAL